jgi:hypothetical protein
MVVILSWILRDVEDITRHFALGREKQMRMVEDFPGKQPKLLK